MKSFLKRVLLSVLGFVLIEIFTLTGYYKTLVGGGETYLSIKKSKEIVDSPILVLGDSVANQIINNKNFTTGINSLTCNQPASMVGQFILLKNYLKAGNHIKKVVLLCTPFSFLNNLNSVYTYHYFLKPFFTIENQGEFSELCLAQIKKIPLYYLAWLPGILTSNYAPLYNSLDPVDYSFLSPLSVQYLQRMVELSKQYGFLFEIMPVPISENFRQLMSRLDRSEIDAANLAQPFKHFFDEIVYMPDYEFVDNVHFKNPALVTDRFVLAIKKEG